MLSPTCRDIAVVSDLHGITDLPKALECLGTANSHGPYINRQYILRSDEIFRYSPFLSEDLIFPDLAQFGHCLVVLFQLFQFAASAAFWEAS